MHPLPLLLSPLFLSHLVAAVTLSLRGYSRDTPTLNLSKRNNLTGVSIKNANDILYGVNITLGGTSFGVVLDTGRHGGSLIKTKFVTHILSVLISGCLALYLERKTLESQSTSRMLSAKPKVCTSFMQAFLIYGCSQGISTWPLWALTTTRWRIKLTVNLYYRLIIYSNSDAATTLSPRR